ncbi:MAG: hypothetical protein KDC71_22680, partial [Acidobacteria bacterium]|nr:hypothetical protein [Acidobacteriota bacterium]
MVRNLDPILDHWLFFFRPSGLPIFWGFAQGSALRLSPWVLTFCPAGQLVAHAPLLGASIVLSVPDNCGFKRGELRVLVLGEILALFGLKIFV